MPRSPRSLPTIFGDADPGDRYGARGALVQGPLCLSNGFSTGCTANESHSAPGIHDSPLSRLPGARLAPGTLTRQVRIADRKPRDLPIVPVFASSTMPERRLAGPNDPGNLWSTINIVSVALIEVWSDLDTIVQAERLRRALRLVENVPSARDQLSSGYRLCADCQSMAQASAARLVPASEAAGVPVCTPCHHSGLGRHRGAPADVVQARLTAAKTTPHPRLCCDNLGNRG